MYRLYFNKKLAPFWILSIACILSSCASYERRITSEPPGAVIYGGFSKDKLKPILNGAKTPYRDMGSGWSDFYYQARKEGYHDSEIYFQKDIYGDIHVHFELTPISGKTKPAAAESGPAANNRPSLAATPQKQSVQPVEENAPASSRSSEKRLALIIGNADYLHGGRLANPVHDARSMAAVLQELGFTVQRFENCDQKTMKRAIDEFGSSLKRYTVGVFFYAGHGVQVKGNNYLLPVDAKLESENDVEYDAVRADRVLAKMESAGTATNIVVLDACRDNPFERSWRRSARGNGLAFMNAPSGSIIAYATAPGETASDGDGRNGLYTSAILEHIRTPGITIETMFKRVRSTIMEKSGKRQIPWESTSLRGEFYFKERKINK